MTAQRPLLETVPETEVLTNNAKPSSSVDRDFWKSVDNVIYEESNEANPLLLRKLFDCTRELGKAKEKIKRLEAARDQQTKCIISRLLLLEGSLIRDKHSVESLLTQKDSEIRRLQTHIKRLQVQSSRYPPSLDSTDSAIGSLDHLNSPISPPSISNDNFKRNVTDPDKSSVEGALMATSLKCRRTKTDPGRYTKKEQSSTSGTPKPAETVDAACQTYVSIDGLCESTGNNKYLEVNCVRELRSYSNPDDFDQVYQKTSDSTKIREKDLVWISNEDNTDELMPADSVDGAKPQEVAPKCPTMTRKKSLSSPDLKIYVSQSVDGYPVVSTSTNSSHFNREDNNFQSNNMWDTKTFGGSDYFEMDNSSPLSQRINDCETQPVVTRPTLPRLGSIDSSSPHSYSTGHLPNPLDSVPLLNHRQSVGENLLSSLTVSSTASRRKTTKSLLADPANGFRFPAPPVERRVSPSLSLSSTPGEEMPSNQFLTPKLIHSLNSSPVGKRRQHMGIKERSESSSIKHSHLLKKPMMFLRSYSVPSVIDFEPKLKKKNHEINEEEDNTSLKDRRTQHNGDTIPHIEHERTIPVLIEEDDTEASAKPWILSQNESTDTLLQDVANHFTNNNNTISKSAIYF